MWLLPTLNRLEKLDAFLKSAIAAQTTTPGLILIDQKDWDINEKGYLALTLPPGWSFLITQAVSMGDKCREAWVGLTARKWVGILNDDHFIVTKHWDQLMLKALDGKNFASANDRKMAPQKATTATIWSMDLLNALEWPIFPPQLQHLFIDDVWENLGRNTGSWRVCMNVVVEHHHVIWGAKDDDTHQRVYNQKSWDMDNAVYQNFMKHDFKDAVLKIKKLQNKPAGQRFNPNYANPNKGLLDEQTSNHGEAKTESTGNPEPEVYSSRDSAPEGDLCQGP
jgi:hypothetical protein